jgi:hypothetical protein
VPGVARKGRQQAAFCFGLVLELGCLLCWFATAPVSAQKSEATPVAEFFRKDVLETGGRSADHFTERRNGGLIAPRRRLTEGQAWAKFEAEYRPPQPSTVPVLRQLESAKYFLDARTFEFDRFIKNIRDNTQFKLDRGGLRHAAPDDLTSYQLSVNPWSDGLKNARVKLDVKPRTGHPYIGVSVSIPFGN